MTEGLYFHFSLPCTGEGDGNSLQCSCLENPRDGGAWWASVYGVAQSRTRLKRLSSSIVLESILISFFGHSCPVVPAPLIEESILVPFIFLPPLSNMKYPYVHGFNSGLSILLHWSVFLFYLAPLVCISVLSCSTGLYFCFCASTILS